MSNNTSTGTSLLEFGGFTVPASCRRIFITAELEPSSGDPRIQPTGFPDIGPVLYPDPSGQHGLICLIESEASMANRLEEVCFSNKYEGDLKDTFQGLPYLRAEAGKGGNRAFKTSSTLDGHRFASDFLAKGKANFGNGEKTLADYIKTTLGMNADGKTMPVARIPEVFQLVMELDPMSLVHGFQISNEQISFVGLRLARALTASIVGLNCERIAVPGIKFNVGQNPGQRQSARFQLLLAIALWKVAAFLDLLRIELSLRSECKLRLKDKPQPQYKAEGGASPASGDFPYSSIAAESFTEEDGFIARAQLPADRNPLVLAFA